LKTQPKFLIDENLSPSIADLLKSNGYQAFHINHVKRENDKISDSLIRSFSIHNKLVVVTSDQDFVSSYLRKGVPERVVYLFFDCKNKAEQLKL